MNSLPSVSMTPQALIERSPSSEMAFPGVLIHHRHHFQPPTVLGRVHGEVIAPDMVRVLSSSPRAAILTPTKQTPALMLLHSRDLQPLLPPEPQDTLFIHLPALAPQQSPYSPVAVARIILGEISHPGG